MIRNALVALLMLLPAPALANVQSVAENGFVVRFVADVPASPDQAWAVLVRPSEWWSGNHTYSGDAKNLSLDVRPGGCFCEVLPNAQSPNAAPRGGVEHLRVVYVERGRALRMIGGLGPLQSDAVTGTMTIMFKPEGAGTRILWEYTVGGYLRTPAQTIAPAVDTVIGEQVASFAGILGGKLASAEPSSPSAEVPEAKQPEIEQPEAESELEPSKPIKGDTIGEIIGR